MRASGAAILGAAAVGAALLFASKSHAASLEPHDQPNEVTDEQVASSLHAHALALPNDWTEGQLKSLENLLVEIGFREEAAEVHDLRVGMFGGDHPDVPAAPLPPVTILPEVEIEAINSQLDSDLGGS